MDAVDHECQPLHKVYLPFIVSLKDHKRSLRLQYTFRSTIFFKFRFFSLSNDPNEISNVKKKSLKKIKSWERNGSFKFWLEVNITCLIDIFSAVVSTQFFQSKRTLLKAYTYREFVQLPPNFNSG